MDDLICFVGQKAFIEKNGELLLLNDPRMGLDLPGGKILENEADVVASLKREVREETNLEIIMGQPFFTWFFTIPLNSGHPSAGKKVFHVGYRCTYVSGEIKLSDEHNWYKWIDRKIYKNYVKEAVFAPALLAYFKDSAAV